ncbi:MAG: hypothetical protein WD688_08140, partial [Candidatus Binatia bacterium]
PVCINSMAQQAKPNSMYHCDEARPQLCRSSTLVVKTVSGNWFNNDVKASSVSAMDAAGSERIAAGKNR